MVLASRGVRSVNDRTGGIFRRVAPMVGALLFIATLALVVTYDHDVRLETRCQLLSWKLRSAALKGTLRGGRHQVVVSLAELGCLGETKAAVVREIETGRLGKGKTNVSEEQKDRRKDVEGQKKGGSVLSPITANKPSVLSDPTAKPQGVDTNANAHKKHSKAAERQHVANVVNAAADTKAERLGDELEQREKEQALKASLAVAWAEFYTLIGGKTTDAQREAYPLAKVESPFPEPTDGESDLDLGRFEDCGTCDACVLSGSVDTRNAGEEHNRIFGEEHKRSFGEEYTSADASADTSADSSADTSAPTKTRTLSAMGSAPATGPRCFRCLGCTTVLHQLDYGTVFGPFRWTNELGATSASVFGAAGEANATTGILKTPCFKKRYPDGGEYAQLSCSAGVSGVSGVVYNTSAKVSLKTTKPSFHEKHQINLRESAAVRNLAEACGLEDVVVRQWTGYVKTSHPASGEKFEGEVLFMEKASGVSLERITRSAPDDVVLRNGDEVKPPSSTKVVHDTLRMVGSKNIIKAALFDFISGQCDRHAQNVLITPSGDFKMIDNDQSFGAGWRQCAANSFFIPGSDKFAIARFGNLHVNGDEPPSQDMNLQVLLDYRCHAPGREIGGTFPAKFARCIDWLAAANVTSAQKKFGFPTDESAAFVIDRAVSLTHRGFEKALRKAQLASKNEARTNPQNIGHRVFAWPEPCCDLVETRGDGDKVVGYTCAKQSTCRKGYDACETQREADWFAESEQID